MHIHVQLPGPCFLLFSPFTPFYCRHFDHLSRAEVPLRNWPAASQAARRNHACLLAALELRGPRSSTRGRRLARALAECSQVERPATKWAPRRLTQRAASLSEHVGSPSLKQGPPELPQSTKHKAQSTKHKAQSTKHKVECTMCNVE